jgi:hypothetical protein
MADSGQATTGVNTFAEGNNNLGSMLGNILPGVNTGIATPNPAPTLKNKDSIDLRPFLSIQDGGTATKLRAPVTTPAPATKDPKKSDPRRFW